MLFMVECTSCNSTYTQNCMYVYRPGCCGVCGNKDIKVTIQTSMEFQDKLIKVLKALKVIVYDNEIRRYLQENDPKALEQATCAIEDISKSNTENELGV